MTRCQFLFYATVSDLDPLMSSLESQKKLQYTVIDLCESDALQTYLSYTDIPDFGQPDHPTAAVGPGFLVALRVTQIRSERVPQKAGGVRYNVSQKLNNDIVVLRPGGLYGPDVLLYGQVGTISSSAASQKLYEWVTGLFRRRLAPVQEFLVGPQALDLCKAGVRLTLSASTPPCAASATRSNLRADRLFHSLF
jgi:hypothetical protein